MASVKRLIYNGNTYTHTDYIPVVNGVDSWAVVNGVVIPWWVASAQQPATKFDEQPSGSTGVNGGYTANGYTIYCSTTINANSYGVWRAFDGININANGWASKNDDTSPWVAIKLTQPLKSITVTIYNRVRSSIVNGPIAGTIEGLDSITGTSTVIGSFSGKSGSTSAAGFSVICNNYNDAYQVVKINLTNWAGKGDSSNNYIAIGEIYIDGKYAKYP